MQISYPLISLSFLCLFTDTSKESVSATSPLNEMEIFCEAPSDVVLFENGVKPVLTVKPNTNYEIRVSTYSPGFACITAFSGFTYGPGNGCRDVTSDGHYHRFADIVTDTFIPNGISMTMRSYCDVVPGPEDDYVPGGSATFTWDAALF